MLLVISSELITLLQSEVNFFYTKLGYIAINLEENKFSFDLLTNSGVIIIYLFIVLLFIGIDGR